MNDASNASGPPSPPPRRRGGPPWGLVAVVVVVAGLVGLGGWLFVRDEGGGAIPGFTRAPEPRAVADIGQSAADVGAIRIEGRGRSIRLQRGENTWRLADRGDYPVPDRRVEQMLDMLAGMKATHVSDATPPPTEEMGLDQLDDPSGQTTRITLSGTDGAEMGAVTIGTAISAPGARLAQMTAVTPSGDPRIWLVEGAFQVSSDPTHWIDSLIADVPPERLQEIAVTAPGGARLVLRRNEEDKRLRVAEGLPPGESVKATWLLRDLAGALEDLRLVDVQPVDEIAAMKNSDEVWRTKVVTDDGLTYRVRLRPEDTGAWAQFRAEAGDGEAAEAARAFNARHAQWAYLLNQYAARQLTVQVRDLLEAGTQ